MHYSLNYTAKENLTIIVRTSGERTTDLCISLLKRSLSNSEIIVISETPFSKAVQKCYEVGINKNRKWTLVIDADVLVREKFIEEILNFAETLPDNTFIIQGLVLDKFFNVLRPAGNHLYRTKYLEQAIHLIPKEGTTLRPEHTTNLKMMDNGFLFAQTHFIAGLHDFEQNPMDIAKKCFVQAHKHKHIIDLIWPLWKKLSKNDGDYISAIVGSIIGKNYLGTVYIDSFFLHNQIQNFHTNNEPKNNIDIVNFKNSFIEETITNTLMQKDSLELQEIIF